MGKKKRLLITIVVIVAVFLGASVAYDTLTEMRDPDIDLMHAAADGMTEDERDDASEDAGIDASDAPDATPTAEPRTDPKALDFSMSDGDGNSVNLLDFEGKPVVLNFWASWCPPCKDEMPDFEKAYQELGEEVQFVMLNLTDGVRETREIGEQYIRDNGFTFPVYFDTNQEGSLTYAIRSIPTTLFIDKDGYIVTGVQGAINEAYLRRGIDLIKP
ncbi:MAG: TlpA family protein disulfide reductase [Clostridiales bacterium]|nr:TlpA family protein disulfide reductase [Clostridiales bacterium]